MSKLTNRGSGMCGTPKNPLPCPEDFKRVVKKSKDLTDSYKDEMIKKSDSFVEVLGIKRFAHTGHVKRATDAINKQRLSNIKNTPAYKAMSTNKNVKNTGVGRTVENYESQIKSGINPYDYQIPKASEIKKIRDFGLESSKSTGIGSAVAKSPLKAAGAYFEMNKVLKNYPNLEKIKKKQEKRIK
jgi:hypothetical protein